MYVATFYSFKGGVGRTMALTNVAFELARAGKRVLIVDFDLEAPGLDTLEISKEQRSTPGIVEYVLRYLEIGEAPDARNYLYRARGVDVANGGLWVMPAGRHDDGYASRLSQIDWGSLYETGDGYLLFEDLKEQWKAQLKFDYVLVDSRTGHTDVAGICTRQLPDATVILFIPNEQNLRGLIKIVRDVRAEAKPPREKAIHVHFVMSNVPDLDDEEDILRKRLRAFKQQLGIGRDLQTIHRYDSLALLNQTVFAKERPRSRLAREYRRLTNVVRSWNPADASGALRFLQSIERTPGVIPPGDLEERLRTIRAANIQNGEVLAAIASIRLAQGRAAEAVNLLEEAVKLGRSDGALFARMAEALQRLGDLESAARFAAKVFESPGAGAFDLLRAIELLRASRAASTQFWGKISQSPALDLLVPDELLWVASSLNQTRAELAAAKPILLRLRQQHRDYWIKSSTASNVLMLCSIGLGDFDFALKVAQELSSMGELGVDGLFNRAVAEWGATGKPNPTLFGEVLQRSIPGSVDANYQQCLAIAYWAVGLPDDAGKSLQSAEDLMRRRHTLEFSCWRYLKIRPEQFIEDLGSIRRLIGGDLVQPTFMKMQSAPHPAATNSAT